MELKTLTLSQLEQAIDEYEEAKARYKEARARKEAAEADLKEARVLLDPDIYRKLAKQSVAVVVNHPQLKQGKRSP